MDMLKPRPVYHRRRILLDVTANARLPLDTVGTRPALLDEMYRHIALATDDIVRRNEQDIHCRKGCSSCCHTRIELFPVEFDRLKTAFQNLPRSLQNRLRESAMANWDHGICPMLVDGACSIYTHRPAICRTHGLPLYSAVRQNSGGAVSVCSLNFTAGPTFSDQDLIDVDEIGMTLIGANLEYTRAAGALQAPQATRKLLDVVLEGQHTETGINASSSAHAESG